MLAKFQLGISEDDPALMIYHPGFDPAISQKKEDLRKNLQKEWWVKSQAGKAATGMQLGEAALGMMIPAGAPATVEGIDAILKGMITGVWTAFEVLVEMVWVGAIQERPNLEESMTAADKKDTGFGSTRKFRNLYRGTFKTGGDDIFRVLEDTRIDALALTRNLIVHSGGKVDVAFDSRRVGLRELDCFSQITVGQHIQITGHIVRDLIGPISTMGFDLVRIVDLWILNQK